MKKRPPSRATNPAISLQQLDQALRAFDPEAESGELARRVVEIIAGQRGLAGARLWRIAEGMPQVWRESGRLPGADPTAVEKILAGSRAAATNGRRLTWVLRQDAMRLGVLEAYAEAPLSEATQNLLGLIRRYSEVALVSSGRRDAVRELSTIIEATKRLNSTLDLGELMNIILQLATRQTSADHGTVFLFDREAIEIWSLAGLGLQEHEIRLPAEKGIAGWVAQHGETVNLANAYEDARFEREVDRRTGYRTHTLLCLPLRNKGGETVGVLQLLNKKDGPFTAGDEGCLRALSGHFALALENAQLHRERLAMQSMERDLAIARSIQISLLPERPPTLAGFEIAVSHQTTRMVGGDYYDFIPLEPDTMLMVVADVAGKGVGSAMVMANVQATLHALLAHVHSLERLMASLNDMILADVRGQKYVTMFLSLLDQRHSVLHYVNAGHVPPSLVRADGTIESLREGGMVIGMFPGQSYERGHVRLYPGDIVVGCTDGITDAMDVESKEYGRERLAKAVKQERKAAAAQIAEVILAEVDRFSKGGPHEDDRVILILKVL